MPNQQDLMLPFFRVLNDTVVINSVSMPAAAFLKLEPTAELLPPDPPVPDPIGRLYVPGRRHCLIYSNGDTTTERGWPWITPMPWPEADAWLARWEELRDKALGEAALVMDMKTGRPIEPAPAV